MRYITVGTVRDEKPAERTAEGYKVVVLWRYKDLPMDKKGWTTDKTYRPCPFDICLMKIEGKETPINGWWTGYEWKALRLRRGNKLLAWKLNKEFY